MTPPRRVTFRVTFGPPGETYVMARPVDAAIDSGFDVAVRTIRSHAVGDEVKAEHETDTAAPTVQWKEIGRPLLIPVDGLEHTIDRDKQDHEELLLAMLAGLFGTAYTHARAAVKVGADPFAAVSGVLTGNPRIGQPGGAIRIAKLLNGADQSGFNRTLKLLPSDDLYDATEDYYLAARQTIDRMLATLHRRMMLGLVGETDVDATLAALRKMWIAGGYSVNGPKGAWNLSGASQWLVSKAYDEGWMRGLARPYIAGTITGFYYSSILDARTSDICRTYKHTKLPIDHPWWLTHWPSNHVGCRSVVLPILAPFKATEPHYLPPPDEGYGTAPAGLAMMIQASHAALSLRRGYDPTRYAA